MEMANGVNELRRWLARWRKPPKSTVAEAYAHWAATYSPNAHNPLMELEQRTMLDLLPGLAGRRALDVACGSGRYFKRLLERGAALVVGLDLSAPMLARAQAFSSHLLQADMCALPLADSSFDVMTCGLAVGHRVDLSATLLEMARVLKLNGVLIYSDMHPLGALAGWQRTFRDQHGREYAVPHQVHLYADHVTACRAAGLLIENVCEPRIEFESRWRGWPAVLVIRARRVQGLG